MGKILSKSVFKSNLIDEASQQKIADEILLQCNGSSNVKMLGLEGEWGSGKSTVVEILKKRAPAETKVFVYDVWAHQEDSFRISILRKLISELQNIGWLEPEQSAPEEKKSWSQRLRDLTTTKTEQNQIPKISWGMIGILALLLLKDFIEPFFSSILEGRPLLHGFSVSLVPLGLFVFFMICIFRRNLNKALWIVCCITTLITMAVSVVTFAVHTFKFQTTNIAYYLFCLALLGVVTSAYLVFRRLPGYKAFKENAEKNKLLKPEEKLKKLEEDITQILSVYQGSAVENVEYTPTFSPMVDEFKEFMGKVSKSIKERNSNRHLIIVFDNIDRMPCKKIQELWGFLQTVFVDQEYECNLTTIVTFDRKRVWAAFDEPNQESHIGDDYIDKTFDLVFFVPRMSREQWEDFFCYKWNEALEKTLEEDSQEQENTRLKVVLNTYSIVSRSMVDLQSRRSIIGFINEWNSYDSTYGLSDENLAPQEWSRWVYFTLFIIKRKEYLDGYSVIKSEDRFDHRFGDDVWNRLKSCYRVEKNEFKDFVSKRLCFESNAVKNEADYDRFREILVREERISGRKMDSLCSDVFGSRLQDFLMFVDCFLDDSADWNVIKRTVEILDILWKRVFLSKNGAYTKTSVAKLMESIRLKVVSFFEKNESWPYESYYLQILADRALEEDDDYEQSLERLVILVADHYTDSYKMFEKDTSLWPLFLDDKIEISAKAMLQLLPQNDEFIAALFKCDMEELAEYIEEQIDDKKTITQNPGDGKIEETLWNIGVALRLNWTESQSERFDAIKKELAGTEIGREMLTVISMNEGTPLVRVDDETKIIESIRKIESSSSVLQVLRYFVRKDECQDILRNYKSMISNPTVKMYIDTLSGLMENAGQVVKSWNLFNEITGDAKEEDVNCLLTIFGAMTFGYPWKNEGAKNAEDWALGLIYNKDAFERTCQVEILGVTKMRWAQGFLSSVMNSNNSGLYERLRDEFMITRSMDPTLFELFGFWILRHGNVLEKPGCFDAILPESLLDGNDDVLRVLKENRLIIQRLAARCETYPRSFMDKFLKM